MTCPPTRSRWTHAQIRDARQIPLKPVCEALGYRLIPTQNGNYNVLGLASELAVKDHYWVSAEAGTSGNTIDFLTSIHGMSFSQAMGLLMP
jgi:hypothetical protein